jgi:hypothetical protein
MRLFPGIARDTRILLADQPVDDAQRQNSRRESEQFHGSHIMQGSSALFVMMFFDYAG